MTIFLLIQNQTNILKYSVGKADKKINPQNQSSKKLTFALW